MQSAIKDALVLAHMRIRTQMAGMVAPYMLFLTGLGGVIYWPPPALEETYATISSMTNLYGIEGPLARAVMGGASLLIMLFAQTERTRRLTHAACLVTVLALIINFHHAGHGLFMFSWLGVSSFGLAHILRVEWGYIQRGKELATYARELHQLNSSLDEAIHAD